MKKIVGKILSAMLKTILIVIIILITLGLISIIYLSIVDVTTKLPTHIIEKCNIEEYKFMDRNVYVVSNQEDLLENNKKTDKNLEQNTETEKIIIYFHGGAYFGEGTNKHWNFIQNVVKDTNVKVIYPDYPLAPKYMYKDVYNMVIPLYTEILNEIENLEKEENRNIEIILMGDSAGGGIALGLLEDINKKQNIRLPSETILISPWLDTRLENSKIDEIQKYDNISNKQTLKLAGITYAGEDGMTSSFVNPILGDMLNFENVTIITGTYDILNPDVYILEEKAKEQGIHINIYEYEKAKHIWFIEQNCSQELNQKGYRDLINLIKN